MASKPRVSYAKEKGETRQRPGFLKQRNASPSIPRGATSHPGQLYEREPRHRGTCFSPSSQGGLRQVIPPCASVISCPNEVASAQPGPGIWSQASLHPTPPRASLWHCLIAEATLPTTRFITAVGS